MPLPTARWVGIDEAGYGPNLGPMVMSAVVAEGPADSRPDLWTDLSATLCRTGGGPRRLEIDDSKRLHQGPGGRARLERALLALVAAVHPEAFPTSFSHLLALAQAGGLVDVELSAWSLIQDPPLGLTTSPGLHPDRPFEGAPWRLSSLRAEVVGPARFNRELGGAASKADVHFAAFGRLLNWCWEAAVDGVPTHVRADKHGGRHFYLDRLYALLPDVWIDRGPEGPELSHYTIRAEGRRLELHLLPRADADDGLVALASIVAKTLRELWMDHFNAFWAHHCRGLRPTAGYPVDAARFRRAIEPTALALGLDPALWWRNR